MIFVYGRDGCGACEQTRKLMNRLEISYTYIDLATDDKLPRPNGEFTSLPIVIIDDGAGYQEWCGFKYDKIKALAVTHGGGGV